MTTISPPDPKIAFANEANAPALNDIEAQITFFKANSYVALPGLLSPELVRTLNAAIDEDRRDNEFLWWYRGSPNNASNLLLTQPVFDQATRLPVVLNLLDRLMGGPVCFEELSVQVTEPGKAAATGWHRDTRYWPEHPLHLEYPQVIAYLTDVDETTHCFTVSPEPADGDDPRAGRPYRARRHGVSARQGGNGHSVQQRDRPRPDPPRHRRISGASCKCTSGIRATRNSAR